MFSSPAFRRRRPRIPARTAWLVCALAIGWVGCATRVEERQITVEKRNGGVERVEVQKKHFVWPWWAPTIERWSE